MKRFLPALFALLLTASCQVDNFSSEMGKGQPLSPFPLYDDGSKVNAVVTFRGNFALDNDFRDAIEDRCPIRDGDLALESGVVFIGNSFLEDGTSPADSLIENAYRKGVLISVVHPDYESLISWCSKKGIFFPGQHEAGEDLLLCAFSNKGWLYELDSPYGYAGAKGKDFCASLLNPFVEWVNNYFKASVPAEEYIAGSGTPVDIRLNSVCQRYDHSYFLFLNDTICMRSSAMPDTVKALSQLTFSLTSYPVNSAGHDWFLCRGDISINNSPMFNGVATSLHGNVKSRFCAYILQGLGFSCNYLGSYRFAAGPVPSDREAGQTFDGGLRWNSPEDICICGPATSGRTQALTASAGAVFNTAGKLSSYADLNIRNTSDKFIVSYDYTVPDKLLGYMYGTSMFGPQAEVCLRGRDGIGASWVIESASLEANMPMRIGVDARYCSMCFTSTSVGAGKWNEHGNAVCGPARRGVLLLNSGRTLTGQVQVLNDLPEGYVCDDLKLWAEGSNPAKDIPDYEFPASSFASGERLVRNVEPGTYLLQIFVNGASGKGNTRSGSVEVGAASASVIKVSEL